MTDVIITVQLGHVWANTYKDLLNKEVLTLGPKRSAKKYDSDYEKSTFSSTAYNWEI